jgi:hypothetical protein
VLHLLFKTPYLLERTALVLYPPLVLGFLGGLDNSRVFSSQVKFGVMVLLGLLVGLLTYNFYKSISLHSFKDWPVQTDTKACIDHLERHGAKQVGMDVWNRDVLENYYSKAYPGNYHFTYAILPETLQPGSAQAASLLQYDHLVLVPPYYDSTLLQNWSLEFYFEKSGTRVYKRRTGL